MIETKSEHFGDLFDRLEISAGDVLFVQSSAQWLKLDVAGCVSLCEALLQRVGPRGTVFMPTYAFRNFEGFSEPGSTLDVRRTPSQSGLVSEVFRRRSDTIRSESWWVPISGRGPLAKEILAEQLDVEHPYAPNAALTRIIESDGKLVGLGVTLHTSSFQHYPDVQLETRYPRPIFRPDPLPGFVRDHKGVLREVRSYVVDNALRKCFQAWNVTELSAPLREARRRHDIGTFCFSYPIALYVSEALRLGQSALDDGRWPPWLKEGWIYANDG